MVKFSFNYKGKNIFLDVDECRTIFQKSHGLMFKKKSKPLLFIFNKPTHESIHSFFCVPFFAIWFIEGKVIDVKFVKPWMVGVKPSQKYDRLLEIPINDDKFKFILEVNRKV
jgi:uncharacterized membrane protein (UPF0127 family)